MTPHTRAAAHVEAAPVDYQAMSFPYRRHPDQDAAVGTADVRPIRRPGDTFADETRPARTPPRHPVVVVGAGPVGLSLAIDLAQQDVPVVLLNNDGRLSVGSRALCFAQRTLEIFDRLGCGQRMVDRGVSWHVGRVFFRDQQVYQFDLLPEPGHGRPAFINLQQYTVEGLLVERAQQLPALDLRWHHAVVGIEQRADHACLRIRTPEGDYDLLADHVVACDGARSPLRGLLGLDTQGRRFKDRFLIADVRMSAPFPAERWFWFDPPFHPGQSVLLHRQPEGIWRIDFQLGWDADPEVEKRPENILPRVRTLMAQASRAAGDPGGGRVGEDVGDVGDVGGADGEDGEDGAEGAGGEVPDIALVWASVYTFSCTRMESFRHGRVLFAGDAAHGVSPFGARGANSGVQDAENLAWKLAWVVRGQATEALLDSYAREREWAADENIRHSSRATDFITPKGEISGLFRNAVLDLARDFEFARKLVNSGRLSTPTTLDSSPLSTDDEDRFGGCLRLGMPLVDAPVSVDGDAGWMLQQTRPGRFAVLVFAGDDDVGNAWQAMCDLIGRAFEGLPPPEVMLITPDRPPNGRLDAPLNAPLKPQMNEAPNSPSGQASNVPGRLPALSDGASVPDHLHVLHDMDGLARQRYDGAPGTLILLRPDQHVCARWRRPDAARLRAAVQRATAHA